MSNGFDSQLSGVSHVWCTGQINRHGPDLLGGPESNSLYRLLGFIQNFLPASKHSYVGTCGDVSDKT